MRSEPYIRLDTGNALPTAHDKMRGQIRIRPASAGEKDVLYLCAKDDAGNIRWINVTGVLVQSGDTTVDSDALILDYDSRHFTVTESPEDEVNIALKGALSVTLGPFYINDLPATATTNATFNYYDTGTASSIGTNGSYRMDRDCRVVGMFINSDASRTAGVAIAKPTVQGVAVDFAANTCDLDATNTQRDSAFVSWDDGVPVAAGDRLGAAVVTAGWAPITANIRIQIVVQLNPA
jgi:hypothetical protein